MLINWEISIGNMIEVSIIVLGGIWTLFSIHSKVNTGIENIGGDIKRLESRAGVMESSIKSLEKALVQLAVQDERMNNLDSRVTTLRHDLRLMQHGEGFILPLPAGRGPK